MPGDKFRESFSDHTVEIRFTPSPTILDRRGQWAKKLSTNLRLKKWRIGFDRIDLFEDDSDAKAYITFFNAGLTIQDADDPATFDDLIGLFLRTLSELPDFGTPIHLTRLGVRSRFLTKYDGTFVELRTRFCEKCLRISTAYENAMAGNLVDIGAPINFIDQHGSFNTSAGPMEREQAKFFFQRDAGLFDLLTVGLYFDVDYFQVPDADMPMEAIMTKALTFSQQGRAKYQALKSLLQAY